MPKSLSWRKMVQKFKRLGFNGPHSGGRHFFMQKGGFHIHIPNPHQSDISKGLVADLLRETGISNDEWERA